MHCRICSLYYYIEEPTAETLPYLNTLRKNPTSAQNQFLVGSQSELSRTNPKTSSTNQSRVPQCRREKNPNAFGSGGGPFLALGSCRTESAR